jgi:hypothetical protein
MADLTDHDKQLIARARELAGLADLDAIREWTGRGETGMAYAAALGIAQETLRRLTDLAERLDGEASRLRNDRARYRLQLGLQRDDDDREALREAGQPGRLTAP